MKILLTGSSGYIGKEIFKKISQNNYVKTLGRKDCDYNFDLSKKVPFLDEQFDRIIHNAGLAHISKSKDFENIMYETNLQGSVRLLDAINNSNRYPKEFIYISSVSVYGLQNGLDIVEETLLNATDPYGKSKLLAEQKIIEWGKQHNVSITILRLPLVVGDSPPGNLAKMINGIRKYKYFSIGSAAAKKSMVYIGDLANLMNRQSITDGVFNLTDDYNPSFKELEKAIAKKYKVILVLKIPNLLAKSLATIGDLFEDTFNIKFPINTNTLNKITKDLTFSNQKAKADLQWSPTKILDYYKNV